MTKRELAKAIMWMMDKGYATGHGDSVVDLLTELEWQVSEREREACAVLCENMERNGAWITKAEAASAIRANRSQATTSVSISKWVGLTDADIAKAMHGSVEGSNMLPYQFARAIEQALKEKNT